jgi:hypothetical protein
VFTCTTNVSLLLVYLIVTKDNKQPFAFLYQPGIYQYKEEGY